MEFRGILSTTARQFHREYKVVLWNTNQQDITGAWDIHRRSRDRKQEGQIITQTLSVSSLSYSSSSTNIFRLSLLFPTTPYSVLYIILVTSSPRTFLTILSNTTISTISNTVQCMPLSIILRRRLLRPHWLGTRRKVQGTSPEFRVIARPELSVRLDCRTKQSEWSEPSERLKMSLTLHQYTYIYYINLFLYNKLLLFCFIFVP